MGLRLFFKQNINMCFQKPLQAFFLARELQRDMLKMSSAEEGWKLERKCTALKAKSKQLFMCLFDDKVLLSCKKYFCF